MAAEVLQYTEKIDRREWLELRRSGIGGSDAPVIVGCSKWKSPYELWLEKVQPVPDIEPAEPEYMRWGRLLEEPVAKEFTERTGLLAHPFPAIIHSVTRPWQLANLDFVVYEDLDAGPLGPLEVKTTRNGDDWPYLDDEETVGVPLWVLAQDLHYLSVTDWEWVWNAVLIGGQELRIAKVHRTQDAIDDLIALEADFFDLVERKVAPAIDGSESTRRALLRRFTPVADKVVEIDPDPARRLIAERAALKAEIAERDALVSDIDNELLAMVGDAEIAQVDGETLYTYKEIVSRRVTTKELKKAHPAICAEFEKTSSTRRLYVPKGRPE
jgi:putative phage-type endonuclease